MKVLIVGATGMLGYSLFQNLGEHPGFDVFATVRSLAGKERFFEHSLEKIVLGVDVTDLTSVEAAIVKVAPEVVINCVGLIKQHDVASQHLAAIAINSLLPHQLASLCHQQGCRLVHFSTDCVFDGKKGGYLESDLPTATDLYGRSKALGEVDYPPHLTLRTSIIGHELSSTVSLVDWFLSQAGSVKGFSRAYFSGLPTCVIARLLADHILPNSDLSGLHHLSVDSIDKFALLKLVAEIYGKNIEINEFSEFEIDRSLNSEQLQSLAGYQVPSWQELISEMHTDFVKRYKSFR